MTPLTVLGGYLGAGKTTIINGLLKRLSKHTDSAPIAVLVNDLGTVNIDANLIRKHSGRTLELTSGCVCCDIRDDLGGALESLRGERFQQVLIETSGVAYPGKVADYAVTWPGYRPAGILVAVDALNLERQKQDKFIGHLIKQQIAEADLLLVTKLDQVNCQRAQTLCDSLPGRFIRVDHGHCDSNILLSTTSESVSHETSADHSSQFRTLAFESDQPLDHQRLVSFLDHLPESVVRAKGWVHDGKNAWWLQLVGNRWTLEPASDIPDGSKLVFITLKDEVSSMASDETIDETLAKLERGLQNLR